MHVREKNVLVVDDDAHVLDFLARILTLHGFNVTRASSADEALRLYSESFSLILSDLTLSGKSGLWLLCQVRERSSRVKFILMSGDPAFTKLEDLALFIRKPFTIEELLAVIEE